MARPIPQNRDHLGILGGPVGAVAALSATHANHAIGLNDYLIEARVMLDAGKPTGYTCMFLSATDATDVEFGYIWSSLSFRIIIGAASYYVAYTLRPGTIYHVELYADRSGLAYVYVDGALAGSVDISAGVAVDLNSTLVRIGGTIWGAGYSTCAQVLLARLFVIDPANFPSAAERAAIAAQRFANPDAESPTLAARPNYATERRVDIPFIDVDQDGTTVPSLGTGAATFTVGGGLHWHDVRTQAERAAISIPGEDWYCFDSTHNATVAAADIGCVQGSYALEAIYRDVDYAPGLTNGRPFYFSNGGATERLFWDVTGAWYELNLISGGAAVPVYMQAAAYSRYGKDGIHVMHYVYDASVNLFMPVVNGQILRSRAVVADLNLSGNLSIQLGIATRRDGFMALRLWNAASLPADYATIIRRRVTDPWRTVDGFTGMTLRGNWEMKIDAVQPASSTVVVNRANPGVGNLTISGGSTAGACFKKVVSHV